MAKQNDKKNNPQHPDPEIRNKVFYIWEHSKQRTSKYTFEDPNEFFQECCEYFKFVDDNPIFKTEVVKSGEMAGKLYSVPMARPYTISAMCLYLSVGEKYFWNKKKIAQEKKDHDWLDTFEKIEQIIFTQKFELSAVGLLNSNVMVRHLGLEDTINNKNNGGGFDAPPPVSITIQRRKKA